MKNQLAFTDLEYSHRKHIPRGKNFWTFLYSIIPWDKFVELIQPYYYKNRTGHPSNDIENMLQMYLLISWSNLSDEGMEDAIYDGYAMMHIRAVTNNFTGMLSPVTES